MARKRGHRIPLVALAAALALPLGACTSPEERLAEHLARAERYEAEGQHREAILEYASAINIDPADAELHERMGDLLSRRGALQNAVGYYREAHRLDPTRIDASMREAQLIAFRNRDRADRLVSDALERAPELPIVHRTVSTLALIDGDAPAALAAAQRAVELDGGDAESWIQVGRVHEARLRRAQLAKRVPDDGVYDAALAAFERADELLGGDLGARLERARVLAAWPKRASEAAQAHLDALALAVERGDPDGQHVAASRLADFAEARSDRDLRIRALRVLTELGGRESFDAWRQLASLHPREEREAILKELLEQLPGDPRAHRMWTNHLTATGRQWEALAHLERVLGDGVASAVLWEDLIRLRLQEGQLSRAREALAKLREQFPSDPVTERARARVAIARGRAGRAAQMLEPVEQHAPTAEGQRLLALALHRRGELDAAAAAIDRALELSPGFSATMVRLKARIHCDARQWRHCARALKQLRDRGLELTPSERLMSALAFYERGQPAFGRTTLESLLGEGEPFPPAAVEFAAREGERAPEKARLHLDAALARQPDYYQAIAALVKLDVDAGRRDAALARLDAAIGAGTRPPHALLHRARILADAGELERAESDALRAFELAPALSGAVDLLQSIYRKRGTTAEAVRSFEEAEAAGVLHAGARLLLARLYTEKGQIRKARRTYEKILDGKPALPDAKVDLAVLLADQGRELDRALELAREAHEANRNDPRAAHAVGYVYLRTGLHEAALKQLRRTAQRLPPDGPLAPTVHYHLGLTLRALERPAQAARAFETALELGGDFPQAEDARRQLEAVRS